VQVLDVDARKGHLLVTFPLTGSYRADVLLDIHGAAAHFTAPELISLCRAALEDEFSLETLRDQLGYAAMYPDEAFARYGCPPDQIAEVRAWAQEWSTQIGLDIAEAEPWSGDTDDADDE